MGIRFKIYGLTRAARTLSVLFAVATTVIACSDNSDQVSRKRADTSYRVVVEPVETSNQRTRVEAVGTSRAMQSITLYSAAAGEVVAVHFTPGEFVEAGQVLLELDSRDEELAVQLAEVQLQEAERIYERFRNSAAAGATVPTTLDAAKTELDSARIALERARIALEYRTIEAPFSGYVGSSDIDAGDRIQSNTPITTLDNRSSLLVSFEVPELLVGKINVGDSIAISTWNIDAEKATGEVIDIDSRINPDTRTFVTRAVVDNSTDRLRPGMSFRVTLDLDGNHYPVLSEISLQWGADGSYIWAVDNGVAKRVPVSIVQRQKGRVLVEADLNVGDLVVVEGIQRLRPGVTVQPDTSIAHDGQPAIPGAG